MDKENVVYVHNGILNSLKQGGNSVIFNNIDEPGGHKLNNPGTERQIQHDITD